jgi:hypothetical protein
LGDNTRPDIQQHQVDLNDMKADKASPVMSVQLGLHRMALPLSFGVMCAKLAAAVWPHWRCEGVRLEIEDQIAPYLQSLGAPAHRVAARFEAKAEQPERRPDTSERWK